MNTPRERPQPRGIRNNNPGNIRHGDKWQGMRAEQTDPDFVQFDSPENGIRALAKVLLAYQSKHGLRTVAQIIARWAPPSENNTAAYIAAVARSMRVDPDKPLVLTDRAALAPLMRAIIAHENGIHPYTAEQMNLGMSRAGVA
jgi:hypothetical protein